MLAWTFIASVGGAAMRSERDLQTLESTSAGLGTLAASIVAGSTKAMVWFESPPDMNTGVVIAIFRRSSFAPVMKRKSRMKLPSLPSADTLGVSTTPPPPANGSKSRPRRKPMGPAPGHVGRDDDFQASGSA